MLNRYRPKLNISSATFTTDEACGRADVPPARHHN